MASWFRRNTGTAVVLLEFGIIGSVFTLIGAIFRIALYRFSGPYGSGMPPFFPWLFLGIGLAFLAAAAGILCCNLSGEQKRRAVVARGNQVQALVTDVRLNRSVELNGRNPYVVECRYNGTNASYLLRSECIFTGCPSIQIGDSVPVYWDEYDPKHYTVDLSGYSEGNLVDLR